MSAKQLYNFRNACNRASVACNWRRVCVFHKHDVQICALPAVVSHVTAASTLEVQIKMATSLCRASEMLFFFLILCSKGKVDRSVHVTYQKLLEGFL
jgi:hypothetical protein